jgi:hypothetical protein
MPSRVIVTTYTDEHSIGGNALEDLTLGSLKGIVACGNSRLKSAEPGDLIVVRAKNVFVIGKLIAPAPEQKDSWKKAGGESWEYCWSYTPLSTRISIDKVFKEKANELCEPLKINPHNLLNSRLCPYAAVPVFEKLLDIYEEEV